MIRRLLAGIFVIWFLGFLWFAVFLPVPLEGGKTDAIVVPTGSGGRIEHGLEVLRAGRAKEMLVTGVDREVKPAEFAAEYKVGERMMECCVSLGFAAVDTRSNASETANWMAERGYRSLRLVTADWHMRRARVEVSRALPDTITIREDAVATEPSLRILFLEYHKLLATWASVLVPIRSQ